jgi:hypothetical protein
MGQVCAGTATFMGAPLQVSGSAGFTTGARGFGVGLALGGAGMFYGVGVGTTHYDAYNGSSIDLSAGAGLEVPVGQGGGVELCPVAAVGHRSGPNNIAGSGANYSETEVGAAIRLGVVTMESDRDRVIPTVGLGFDHVQQVLSATFGGSTKASHTFGALSLGVGFVFNRTVTFLPEVVVPIGLDNSSPSFDLSLAVNFGH